MYLYIGEIVDAKGWNIQQFAAEAKIDYNTAYELYKGLVIRLDLTTLNTICETLDINPSEVIVRWRGDLQSHCSDDSQSEGTILSNKLLTLLKNSRSGLTVRDLCRQAHKSKKEITNVLDELRLAGHVAVREAEATNGRTIQVWTNIIQSEQTKLSNKLLTILKNYPSGLTMRDLSRKTNQTKKEIIEALEVFHRAGQVIVLETKAANGRAMQVWRATDATNLE